MILRRDQPMPRPDGTAPSRMTVEPPDEIERAKVAVLSTGTRYRKRKGVIRGHPLLLGVGLFVAGVMIGRSRILRGVFATAAVVVARTAAQRLTGRVARSLRL